MLTTVPKSGLRKQRPIFGVDNVVVLVVVVVAEILIVGCKCVLPQL
jgi:hypothetical protein